MSLLCKAGPSLTVLNFKSPFPPTSVRMCLIQAATLRTLSQSHVQFTNRNDHNSTADDNNWKIQAEMVPVTVDTQ